MFRLFAFVAVLLLAMQSIASADQPLQERKAISFDGPAVGASAVCGFPIRVHAEGDEIFTVFYDNTGNIIREVDVFPNLKVTVYRPGTTQSYTTASPAVLTQYYTDNAAIGSPVTGVLTGLVEKIPGVGLDSGRAVLQGVVTGYDSAGVPLNHFSNTTVSSAGPDFPAAIRFERCAFFQQ